VPFVVVVAVAVTGVLAYAGVSGNSESPNEGPGGFTLEAVPSEAVAVALRQTASLLSRENGNVHPATGQVVASTRQAAAALLDPGVDLVVDAPVYVVQVEGKFIGENAKVPPDAALPEGEALYFTFDPASGQVMDWGIEPHAAELSSLGQVTKLTIRSS
jgi:hypothetical protein